MYIIKEEKQVGIIYHFTNFDSLEWIMEDKGLRSEFNDYISFTRNFNVIKNSTWLEDKNVRLTLDGNKMSTKYKFEPFDDFYTTDKTQYRIKAKSEDEERILWPKNKVLPCINYIKHIDIVITKAIIKNFGSREEIIDEMSYYIPEFLESKISFVDHFLPYRG